MKRIPLVVLAALGAIWGITPASAQSPISISSDALEMNIGGRLQAQYNTTTWADSPPSEMILRRARLELEVKLNDLVSGVIEPEFAGDEVMLKDAYIQLDFSPAFQIRAGNAYKPFSLIENTSSTRILPIERGARVRGVAVREHYTIINSLDYSDRDIGLQVMGSPGFMPLGFRYQAGIFRGPLHGESNFEDSYQFAARATIQPSEIVRIGAGWSSRQFAESPLQDTSPFERGHAYEVDLEVGTFDPGLHFLGEVAFGDADPLLGDRFFGAQGWLAWRSDPFARIVSAVEPVMRASYGDVDGAPTATLLTPGINVYFGGRNRFMVNYDFVLFDGDKSDDTEGSFKAQMQIAF